MRGFSGTDKALLLTFLALLCQWLTGCGGSRDPGQVVLERAPVDGSDLAKASGVSIFKFVRDASREVHVDVEFWVEDHVRSQAGAVTQTHELGRWSGDHLLADLLIMLPGRESRQCYLNIDNSGVASQLPDDTQIDVGAGAYVHAPQELVIQLGDATILAVEIYSDEMVGASADSTEDCVEENIKLGKYSRILVYKVRITPSVSGAASPSSSTTRHTPVGSPGL